MTVASGEAPTAVPRKVGSRRARSARHDTISVSKWAGGVAAHGAIGDQGPVGSSNPLGVVIITRNQVWNVRRLVESVLRDTRGIPGTEIVLVDSASTDGTAEIAAEYPIRVVRLRGDQHLGPAAGRYVGFSQVSGEFVLFLDGDTELYPGWLMEAITTISARPEVGAVAGREISLPLDAVDVDKPPTQVGPCLWREAPHGGGKAMYRRAALDEVGTFHPFLHSDEEPELCIRLRTAGYVVLRSSCPSIYEYEPQIERIGTLIGRWRRNLYLGAGESLRLHLGRSTFRLYLRERGFGIAPLAFAVLGVVASVLGVVLGSPVIPGIWCGALVVSFAGTAVRRRSLRRALHSVVLRLLIADGTLRGFVRGIPAPDRYPARLDVVRRGPEAEPQAGIQTK